MEIDGDSTIETNDEKLKGEGLVEVIKETIQMQESILKLTMSLSL